MRFMVLVKGSAEAERGELPDAAELAEMGRFNEELAAAGVLLAADGLQSSAKGARVRFGSDGASTVVDGPFAETKELVAGYWVWEVSSREEAVRWLQRAPFRDTEVEVRQVFEAADFADVMPPGAVAREQELRAGLEGSDG